MYKRLKARLSKGFHYNIKRKFFTVSAVQYRNALSREVLESPFLKTFQKWSGKDDFSVGLA